MQNLDKRHVQRDLFRQDLLESDLDNNYSFIIDYYPSLHSLMNSKPVPACFYRFPSHRACVAWLFYNMPDIFYFEIKVVHEPVFCPAQYKTFE